MGQGECKNEERERQQRKTRNGEINNKERERDGSQRKVRQKRDECQSRSDIRRIKGGKEGTGYPMLEERSIMFYMTEQNDGVNPLVALFSSLGG